MPSMIRKKFISSSEDFFPITHYLTVAVFEEAETALGGEGERGGKATADAVDESAVEVLDF